MKKVLLVSSLLVASSGAMANECDIELDGKLSFENQLLTVTTDKDDVITIDQYHNIAVNGDMLTLDAQQQQWAEDYYQGIHDAVPQVVELAHDGIELASVAIEQVLGEMLGVDTSEVAMLTEKLNELNGQIDHSFYADDGSIRIHSEQFDEEHFFGDAWEEEFEEAVEEVVMESMGRLMVAIGTEMMFSGGNMDSFEERMENFASEIEGNLEFKGEQLEEKADALCYSLASVDFAENQLQQTLEPLKDLNVFNVLNNKNAM